MIGSLIAISFGTVFVMVNSGGLAEPWPVIVRVVAGLVAVGLVVALFRTPAEVRGAVPARGGFKDRRYWLVVLVEVVALFGGLALINQVLGWPEASVAWVTLVVGVHFFGLAWAWGMPMYHWLGAVMTALGVSGFVVFALGGSEATVGLVAGVGSGFALYGAVVAALLDVRRARSEVTV
ncbi:hypothetical protein [Actinoplanes sp. GCM10030250]|uniref:hypothetical protein n=1 Tax=Actinoplanes sp. GCM10030250 TaxID=3273376 RepID=UPI003607A547